jgi:anti-anti-sigma factor
LIIRLAGEEWDLSTCEELEELLAPGMEHPTVVIDMTAVRYMDSSSLRKLVQMYQKRVNRAGFSCARLVISSPNIRRLFAIVNLDEIWPIFETLEEACSDASISNDPAP